MPGEPPSVGVMFPLFRCCDEVADSAGVVEAAAVGLADADLVTVAFSPGVAVGLPQSVPVALACGVLLPPGLEVALAFALLVAMAVAVAVAVVVLVLVAVLVLVLGLVAGLVAGVAVGLPVAVALTVLLALAVGPPLPDDGLVSELGGEVDGLVGGCEGVIVGLGEPGVGVGEGETDDGEHDTSGVGSFRAAEVVAATPLGPVPLPKALPPLPGPAELAALAAWWPSRASDTDERNGGTAARTTPTAKTATPIAIAGLSSASRQSPV